MSPFSQQWVMQQWDGNCPVSQEEHDTVCIVTECSYIIENANKLAKYALGSVPGTAKTVAARERIIKYFDKLDTERIDLYRDLIKILGLPAV